MRRAIGLLSVIGLFCVTGCKHEKKELEDTYLVTSPLRMDTVVTREYVCQIRAIQHIELRALVAGYLEKIFVDEGKFIQEGQLMFQILPIQYKAEFQKAQAEANYAEIEYKNAKVLYDSNVIAQTQLALVNANLEKAKAELEFRKVRMGFAEIKAPFSGLMDRFQVRLGSLLDEGDLLTTLSDISTLWVYFNVPEAEYLGYKKSIKGDSLLKVQLRTADGQIYDHKGEVRTIEADFNNKTGNIAFRATFPNPKNLLRHGETGNVVMTVPLKNVLIIPQKATYEVLDQKYVFVIDKNGVLKSRRIVVGAQMTDLFVIKEGLNENDKILLEGLRKVTENEKIVSEYQDPKQVIAHLKLHAE